jgi:hypothetical protein
LLARPNFEVWARTNDKHPSRTALRSVVRLKGDLLRRLTVALGFSESPRLPASSSPIEAIAPEVKAAPRETIATDAKDEWVRQALQLQEALESILGVTTDKARQILGPTNGTEEHLTAAASALNDWSRSYKAVWLNKRSALESAFDSFFDQFNENRVGAGFLKLAFQEERSRAQTESARCLLDELDADLASALSSPKPDSPTLLPPEDEIGVGDLRRLLQKLFRRPGLARRWLLEDTANNLATILRLAPAIGHTLSNGIGHLDSDGGLTIDDKLSLEAETVHQQWAYYWHAFPARIRVEVQHEGDLERLGRLIFDDRGGDSDEDSWRPLFVVTSAKHLPEATQKAVLAAFRTGFATRLLYDSDMRSEGPIEQLAIEREYLNGYHPREALEELLGADDFERLNRWLETARAFDLKLWQAKIVADFAPVHLQHGSPRANVKGWRTSEKAPRSKSAEERIAHLGKLCTGRCAERLAESGHDNQVQRMEVE